MSARFPKWRIIGLLSAWIAALLIVALLVAGGRRTALDRGERATAAFAAVVEQQVERTFQTVYLTLGAIGDAHQLTPRPVKNDREFQEMMTRRLDDIPFVRALFIIAKDGWIIHDTDYPRTPEVPLTDRNYFRAYLDDPQRPSTVWPPVLSRSGTGWFLPVTRPLAPGGELEGVVVAAIQATHFHEQFRAATLPEGYLVSLFHQDGILVASYPQLAEEVGKNYRHLSMFEHLAEAASGTFWTERGMRPGKRIVSYRAVPGAPFVVRVSRGEGDLLAEWRRTATAAGLAMLALTVFVVWVVMRMARASAQRALARERRMQAEKMEALGQLSGGMAHDFANLFGVVGLNLEVLRTNPSDPAIAQPALAAIGRAVEGGRHVAERLLAFARRRPLALVHVRLDDWLHAAEPLLGQAAGSRVLLDVQSAPGLPEIVCDAGELDVTLLNLVINARDAMAQSGRIEIRAYPCDEESAAPHSFVARPPRFVCLTVKDNGPGMPESVRRRALDPFYTTKGEAGTGLGLSQVYGFMQQLGGQVAIESAPGRGTAVHLYFPVAGTVEGRSP